VGNVSHRFDHSVVLQGDISAMFFLGHVLRTGDIEVVAFFAVRWHGIESFLHFVAWDIKLPPFCGMGYKASSILLTSWYQNFSARGRRASPLT
jgi:hypothetical protein